MFPSRTARPLTAEPRTHMSNSVFGKIQGVRKEVKVDGLLILIFWYRNQIYAIEGRWVFTVVPSLRIFFPQHPVSRSSNHNVRTSRSPAEGAYSEGFIRAKFTQVSQKHESCLALVYGQHIASLLQLSGFYARKMSNTLTERILLGLWKCSKLPSPYV